MAAAAFHDSGKDGAEGEFDNHAIASARLVKEYFENNPSNPFGITSENLSIIQAVIEYHEYKEPEIGITDRGKLQDLCYRYNIDSENLVSLVKISELLKDADALDRTRFGKRSENRWSLDTRYLKSETAKSISMLRFSEQCNFELKEREKNQPEGNCIILNQKEAEDFYEGELNEFNRPKIQMSSLKQKVSEITAKQKKKFMDTLKDIQNIIKKLLEGVNR